MESKWLFLDKSDSEQKFVRPTKMEQPHQSDLLFSECLMQESSYYEVLWLSNNALIHSIYYTFIYK